MSDMKYVTLDTRLGGLKLVWLLAQLVAYDIAHRTFYTINGMGVEVREDLTKEALEIYYTVIGELIIVSRGSVTFADLDNDHEIFRELLKADAHPNDSPVSGGLVLPSQPIKLPGIPEDPIFYDVNSSNLSALSIGNPNDTVFARFKGGDTIYMYRPVPEAMQDDLLREIKRKALNEPDASVGSLFHHTVIAQADNGIIQAWKTINDNWEVVPTKAERIARRKIKGAVTQADIIDKVPDAVPKKEATFHEEAQTEYEQDSMQAEMQSIELIEEAINSGPTAQELVEAKNIQQVMGENNAIEIPVELQAPVAKTNVNLEDEDF